MNAFKVIRDTVIVLVLIVLGIVFFGSREPGPVERVHENMPAGQDGEADQEEIPISHSTLHAELSDGETLFRLGDLSVGRDWFGQVYTIYMQDYVSEGIGEEMAGSFAFKDALLMGMEEIIIQIAVAEFGIVPDPDEVAAREEEFYSSFETEGQAEETLDRMGMSIESVYKLWESESMEESLKTRIATTSGIEPGTPEADEAYSEWLIEKVFSAEWIFEDPTLEELFIMYREDIMAQNPAEGAAEPE